MKKYLLLLTLFGAFGFSDLLAAPPSYIQTDAFTLAKEKAATERTLTVYTKETLTLKLGTGKATAADVAGRYSILAAPGDILVVTRGYFYSARFF